jgi:hypothetical protein
MTHDDDDDTQVYADTLLIVYQRGFADGKQAAQRPWVGLTDEDFLGACQIAERGNYLVAFQRIQAKLKERNT